MHPEYQKLSSLPPIRRHYAIGANCYQHMRGYDKAIIAVAFSEAGQDDIFQQLLYLSIYPANAAAIFANTNPETKADVKKIILDACKEDNLIVLEGALETISDMTPAAVYFSQENTPKGQPADFHFIVRKGNGTWEDKMPLTDVRTYQNFPQQIDHYEFSNFLLVPQTVSKAIQKLNVKFKKISDGSLSTEIALADVEQAEMGNTIILNSQDKTAIVDNDFYEFEIPSPSFIPMA